MRARRSGFGWVVVGCVLLAGCSNGERLRLEATRAPTAGQPLPPLELEDLGGQPVDLARYEGRALLVNLWATWCVPCKAEMPELQELQERYPPETLTVLGVTIDEGDMAPVVAFLEELGITYPNVRGEGGELLERLELDPGVPHTLLLDDEGLVRGYWRGRFFPFDPSVEALLDRVLSEET